MVTHMQSIISLLLSLLIITACSESTSDEPIQLAKSRITETTSAVVADKFLNSSLIIDVREAVEVKSGMLPNAVHIPLGSLQTELPKYLQGLENQSKDQSIVLYCRSGNRSALGADTLQQLGYTNVVSMQGGMKAWKAGNHSVVTSVN